MTTAQPRLEAPEKPPPENENAAPLGNGGGANNMEKPGRVSDNELTTTEILRKYRAATGPGALLFFLWLASHG